MSRLGTPKAPISDWGVELLRFSIFCDTSDVRADEKLWQFIVGTDAENVTSKPKTNEFVVAGKWQDRPLLIQTQKTRMDWIFTPGEDPEQEPLRYQESADSFVELLGNWKFDVQNISRFAFGAVVSLPWPDVETAYSTISNYMNFDLDRSTCSDFIYQLNRKSSSDTITGLEINRLCKWAVSQMAKVNFVLMDGKMVATQESDTAGFACRVEMDMNTNPKAGFSIPADKIHAIAIDLNNRAQKVLCEGDVP